MSVFFLSLSLLISLQVTEICVAVLFPWKLFCIVACYLKSVYPVNFFLKILLFSFSQSVKIFSLHYRDLLKNNFTAHLLNMKELFSISSAPIKMGNKKWRSIFNTGQFIAWHRMHFKGWLALKDKCLEITEKSIAYIQCFKGGEKIYQSEPRQILNYQRNAKQGLLFLFCFGQ